jgi:large subunit ribosomal protein L28
MARICDVCEKRPFVGNFVSNANNRVKRWIYPNVHVLRYKITGDPRNHVNRGPVCTKCVKAGKVEKVI